MYNDLKRLLAAVSMATGRGLDPDEYDDRMTMQKGCYILNSWGYGPRYRFDMYVRGPYSSKLADDFCTLVEPVGCDTDVSEEDVSELRSIFDKGPGYTEAYATVLMIKNNSPRASFDSIHRRATEVKPRLTNEIEEACSSILV